MPTPSPSEAGRRCPIPTCFACPTDRSRVLRRYPLDEHGRDEQLAQHCDRSGVGCTVDAQAGEGRAVHVCLRDRCCGRGARERRYADLDVVGLAGLGFHYGIDPSTPDGKIPQTGCCLYTPDVAVDSASGQACGLHSNESAAPALRERDRPGGPQEDGGSLRDPSSARARSTRATEPRSRAGSGPAASTSSGRAIRRSRRSRCGRSTRRSRRSCSRQIATSMRTSLQRPTALADVGTERDDPRRAHEPFGDEGRRGQRDSSAERREHLPTERRGLDRRARSDRQHAGSRRSGAVAPAGLAEALADRVEVWDEDRLPRQRRRRRGRRRNRQGRREDAEDERERTGGRWRKAPAGRVQATASKPAYASASSERPLWSFRLRARDG